jgi:hypothetical protein
MPGGHGMVGKEAYEQEQAKSDLKRSNLINEMDDELKGRFKALKIIQDFVTKGVCSTNTEVKFTSSKMS